MTSVSRSQFSARLEAESQRQIDSAIECLCGSRSASTASGPPAKSAAREPQGLGKTRREQIAFDDSRVHVVEQVVEKHAGRQSVLLSAGIAASEESAGAAHSWTAATAASTTRAAHSGSESTAARTAASSAALPALAVRRGALTPSPRPAESHIEVELTESVSVIRRDDFHSRGRIHHEIAERGRNQTGG